MEASQRIAPDLGGSVGTKDASAWQALKPGCTNADFESVINRVGADGQQQTAFALKEIYHHSPTLATNLAVGFAHCPDKVELIVLALGDVAAGEVCRRAAP